MPMPKYLERFRDAHRAAEGSSFDGIWDSFSIAVWRVDGKNGAKYRILAPDAIRAIIIAAALDGDKARYDRMCNELGGVILENVTPCLL